MEVVIYNLSHNDSDGQMVYPVRGVRFGWQGARNARLTANVGGSHIDDGVTVGWGESWKTCIPREPEDTLYWRVAEAVSEIFPNRESITVVLYKG